MSQISRRMARSWLPSALNRGGRIAQQMMDLAGAEEMFREGIEVARVMGDAWFVIANIVHLAELLYERDRELGAGVSQADLKELEDYARELVQYRENGYQFSDLYGRMERTLGNFKYDLAISCGRPDLLRQALMHYISAYPQIATGFYVSHGVRALPREREELGNRIDSLPAELALEWCEELGRVWADKIDTPSLMSFVSARRIRARQRLSKQRSGK